MSKETKKRVIRKRNIVDEGRTRPYIARVRMSKAISSKLASIQGLCYAFGNKESLAELFEKVAMPAFAKFVEKYAEKARNFKS
jgi:hypothetical protein